VHITKNVLGYEKTAVLMSSMLVSMPVVFTHYSYKHKKKWKHFMCLIIST